MKNFWIKILSVQKKYITLQSVSTRNTNADARLEKKEISFEVGAQEFFEKMKQRNVV